MGEPSEWDLLGRLVLAARAEPIDVLALKDPEGNAVPVMAVIVNRELLDMAAGTQEDLQLGREIADRLRRCADRLSGHLIDEEIERADVPDDLAGL